MEQGGKHGFFVWRIAKEYGSQPGSFVFCLDQLLHGRLRVVFPIFAMTTKDDRSRFADIGMSKVGLYRLNYDVAVPLETDSINVFG